MHVMIPGMPYGPQCRFAYNDEFWGGEGKVGGGGGGGGPTFQRRHRLVDFFRKYPTSKALPMENEVRCAWLFRTKTQECALF